MVKRNKCCSAEKGKDVPKMVQMKYFVCFCKVAVSLAGAICCYNIVSYSVVGVLVTYFTGAFNQGAIYKSAVLVNVLGGLQVLVVVCSRAYPTSSGFRKIIIFSTTVYILGLLMLYLSASNRITKTNFALCIFVCVLIAVGKGGGSTILKRYLLDQLVAGHENIQHINWERARCRRNVWLVVWLVPAGISVLITPLGGSWSRKFSNSMYMIGAAGFISLGGSSCFSHQRHQTETTKKDRETLHPDQLLKNRGHQTETQQESPICPVKQVNVVADRGPLLRMIPMWSTFIVFSLVTSTADTFFNLQDDSMVAHDQATTSNFLLAKDVVKVVADLLCRRFLASTSLSRSQQNFLLKITICLGMILSVICPSLAWQVEVQRLKKAHEMGLLDKPEDEKVPMSDWCMAPLFGLWGLMEGFSMRGLDEFFNYHVPKSTEDLGSIFNQIPIVIGNFLSAVCVSVCKGWLGATLNKSRLDKYYRMITVLAWINLCWFFFVTTFYSTNEEEAADEGVELKEAKSYVIIADAA